MGLDDKTPMTRRIRHPWNGYCPLTLTEWQWGALDVIVEDIGRPLASILAKFENARGDFDLGHAVRRYVEDYVDELTRDDAA